MVKGKDFKKFFYKLIQMHYKHHECNICDNKGLYYTTKNHKNAVLEGIHILVEHATNKDKVHIFIDPDFKVISSYIEQLTDEDVTLFEELTIPATIHYIIRKLYLNYLHSKETLKNNIIMSNDFYFVSIVADISQLIEI